MASMGNAQRGALGGLAKLGEGARTTSDLSRVGGGLSRGANEGKKLNAAPWSDTWPAAGATLDLDFANNRGFVRGVGQGGVMDAITFTRASNGTFVKPDGTLSTHANQGALGNNLLSFPQDFVNNYWLKTQSLITANVENSPNKTLTANLFEPTLTTSNHRIEGTVTNIVSGQDYSFSVYAKKNTSNFIQVVLSSGTFGFNAYANFDLNLGNLGDVGTSASAQINEDINGWYRCIVTATATSSVNATPALSIITNSTSSRLESFLGTNESIFIWGAQLEVGSTATEYFPTNIGEPRFDWASTEQVAQRNLLRFTEEFDNSFLPKFGMNAFGSGSIANTILTTDPLGGNTAEFFQESTETDPHAFGNPFSVSVGDLLTFSIYVKSAGRDFILISGTSFNSPANIWWANYSLIDGQIIKDVNVTASSENIGDGWWRLIYTYVAPYTIAGSNRFGFWVAMSDTFTLPSRSVQYGKTYTGDGISGIYAWGAQLELGDTATTYQSVGTFIPSTTPLRANPTSNGILIEEARTNRLLWNRDATQTEWVKTNITATKDQTGIDGVANSASSLTATDDNGTCIQTITLAAGNRTGSVYLKRLTGTGNIQVTLDGSTYSTVELSDTEWYRIVLSGSVTNPTVGIKIAVDGDAVAMDYGQVEDGLFVTTPILTTTATATRALETVSIQDINFDSWYNQTLGTIYAKAVKYNTVQAGSVALFSSGNTLNGKFGIDGTGGNDRFIFLSTASGGTLSLGVTPTKLGENKYALSYNSNNIQIIGSNNGNNTDELYGIFPHNFVRNTLNIGQFAFTGTLNRLNGCIKELKYFPNKLTANEINELTK
jgi:hypothetical protein